MKNLFKLGLLVPCMAFVTSCGTKLNTQIKFGRSSTQLCGYNPCDLGGEYADYYATTEIRILLNDDEAVTLKASNISITTSDGIEYQCKGFATLKDGDQHIQSVASEFKFTAKNEYHSYVMFDNEMYSKSSGDTGAKAKINSTKDIPFYTFSNITFNI